MRTSLTVQPTTVLASMERFGSPRVFALLTALWLVGLAWIRPLTVPDEGRYSDIARWIVLSGDWLVPRLNGLPFVQKPPLFFWLEAIGIGLAGTGVLVCRAVSLAAALATTYAVYRFVRARIDEAAARWTVIVLVTSPLFFATAQFASLDMLVSACITATILFAVQAAETPAPAARRLWLAAYATAALGVLAKGLIGIVIPGLVFTLWALVTRRPRALLDAIQLRGLLLLALIAAPWFVLVEQRLPGFLHYFFVHNHFERYAESSFNNPRPLWYYPAVLFGGTLPWILALVAAVRAARTGSAQPSWLPLLGLVWAVAVLVFFSVPRSKLPGYILPAVPALAIVLGPWCAHWRHRKLLAVAGVLLSVALIPAAMTAKGLAPGRLAAELRGQIAESDRVVFLKRYFFSVPLILERKRAVEVVDDWSVSSTQMPDSWRRELAEGREFEPARAEGVLLSPAQFAASLADTAPVWVWAVRNDIDVPELAGFTVVRERGEYVVLHRPRGAPRNTQ
jgi:4-amino-4-deoxy-L-arabinose transferase-like glycosyltransferase